MRKNHFVMMRHLLGGVASCWRRGVANAVFPYLLSVAHVWCADITYIPGRRMWP